MDTHTARRQQVLDTVKFAGQLISGGVLVGIVIGQIISNVTRRPKVEA